MNNLQETLLFPFRDRESRTQFLIACAVMLAGFFIPLLPTILLMGYSLKIMRQIIVDKLPPSMPSWQGSDWSEMFMDGLRLYGAQLVLLLPVSIPTVLGILLTLAGSIGFSAMASEDLRQMIPVAALVMFIGVFLLMIISIIAIPYSIVMSAAHGHVAARRSFRAAFEFTAWWQVFRAAMGQFVIAYAMVMLASFLFTIIMQVAAFTIVLTCFIPLLFIPYMAYFVITLNVFYAQAYAKGLQALQAA
jgi:hypothetical protein